MIVQISQKQVVFHVNSVVAMNRQNVMIAQPEKHVQIYYREDSFKEQLKQAKILRAEGKNVELLPEA